MRIVGFRLVFRFLSILNPLVVWYLWVWLPCKNRVTRLQSLKKPMRGVVCTLVFMFLITVESRARGWSLPWIVVMIQKSKRQQYFLWSKWRLQASKDYMWGFRSWLIERLTFIINSDSQISLFGNQSKTIVPTSGADFSVFEISEIHGTRRIQFFGRTFSSMSIGKSPPDNSTTAPLF